MNDLKEKRRTLAKQQFWIIFLASIGVVATMFYYLGKISAPTNEHLLEAAIYKQDSLQSLLKLQSLLVSDLQGLGEQLDKLKTDKKGLMEVYSQEEIDTIEENRYEELQAIHLEELLNQELSILKLNDTVPLFASLQDIYTKMKDFEANIVVSIPEPKPESKPDEGMNQQIMRLKGRNSSLRKENTKLKNLLAKKPKVREIIAPQLKQDLDKANLKLSSLKALITKEIQGLKQFYQLLNNDWMKGSNDNNNKKLFMQALERLEMAAD